MYVLVRGAHKRSLPTQPPVFVLLIDSLHIFQSTIFDHSEEEGQMMKWAAPKNGGEFFLYNSPNTKESNMNNILSLHPTGGPTFSLFSALACALPHHRPTIYARMS
jgi:hypothetical protein